METPQPVTRTFTQIQKEDSAHFVVTMTPDLAMEFAHLSGDYNPLHVAEKQPINNKNHVAHGMLAGAFFSRLVGMYLPGLHALYLSQSLQFKKPISFGTEVIVEGVVTDKSEAAQTITLALTLKDSCTKETLVAGEALVRVRT